MASAALELRDDRWAALERKHQKGPPARLGGILEQLPILAPLREFQTIGSTVVRLEALERELVELLARSAPSTWAASRRPLTRVLRAARRELRANERRPLIGERS